MDGPGDYYTKGSKLDKERQLLYGITYMWHLIKMKQMNFFFFFTKKNQIYRPQNQIYGYQRGNTEASDRLSRRLSSKEYACQCRRM